MKETVQKRVRQTTTVLIALALVLSILGPIGTVGAQSVSVSNTPETTTAAPGETVSISTTISGSDINGQGVQVFLPEKWQGTITDADGGTPKPESESANVLEVVWLSNGTYTVSYDVQVPADATEGDYTVDVEGSGIAPSTGGRVTDTAQTTIAVEEPNDPPVADAGDDQTVDEGDSVTLDASDSSDPDGDSLSYSWTQTAGTSVSLSDASSATPTFTAPEVDEDETLTFEVEVDDGNGGTATDTVDVTVQNVPAPANFQVSNLSAPDSAIQGDNITVSADVTNDGDEEATQTVEFRLDLDGDGTAEEDEELASQEVTLAGGETQTVTFSDIDTGELLAGDYTHGVFTDDDSATATITIDESEASASETSVSLSPDSAEVVIGDTETYDVVVDSADGGVGAYELTVSLDDASVASITDVSIDDNPDYTDVSYAEDNSSVTITTALMDTDDTGSVSIASIAVEGMAEGSSDLSVDVQALGNEAGESYIVTDETGASVSVIEIGPVNDFSEPPTDPDDDGLYEDVNGDGEFNIVDVQALFANLDDSVVQNNPDKFDFNQDGGVDVVDVQKLYNEVLSE